MFNKYRAIDITRLYMEKSEQLHRLSMLVKSGEPISDKELQIDSFLNIFFEPTNRCNLNCYFCARNSIKRDFSMLDFETFKNGLSGLPKGSYLSLFGNGEPTLNVHLYDMVKYACEQGMFVSVTTNATALNEVNRKKLMNSGVSRVQFSFQSIDKEEDEQIMRGIKFRQALLNILYFIYDVRKNKKPIYISISRVKIDETKPHADVTRKFWEKMPIDNYYEGELLSLQTDSNMYRVSISDTDTVYKPCSNPWTCVKINANGDVNPCVLDFSSKFVLGNIQNDSLINILNSPLAIEFRRALLTGDMHYLDKIGYHCGKCNAWGTKIKGNLDDAIQYHLPLVLGTVINEIAADRPSDTAFLEKAMAFLESGNEDIVHGLMEG